jgi:hypothetical protein
VVETETPRPAAIASVEATAPAELSIVILTHNVRGLLRNCLASVLASEVPFAFEVCVVDSGSDGSAAVVRSEFPGIDVIEVPDNPGFAAANNLGLRRVRGRYVLLLNPDTVLPPHTLAATVREMEADPTVGILGPKLVRGDGSLDLACRRAFPTPANALFHFLRLPRLLPNVPRFGAYNLTYRDPDRSYDVDAISAAFMLIRREVLDRIGLFDETYWMYGEDLDLCLRSRQRGWRTRYAPVVEVLHLKGQSSKARSLRCTYEFFRAMHVFYRKHYAPAASAPFNALVTAGIVLLGACSLVADRLRPAARRRVS